MPGHVFDMLGNGLRIGIAGIVQHHRRQPGHAAQQGGLLQRQQEIGNRMAVGAVRPVSVGVAAGADHHQHRLAAQRGAARPVGPAGFEDFVDPELQQRRHAVPAHRELQDHRLGGGKQPLLGHDVDVVIHIEPVELAHGHVREGRQCLGERTVDARTAGRRMRIDHNDGGLVHGGWQGEDSELASDSHRPLEVCGVAANPQPSPI
ncbi:hypothetical protein D3C72_1663370 [compost metagenome]